MKTLISSNIPRSRAIFYIIIVAMLPLVFVFLHFLSNLHTVQTIENQIEFLKEKIVFREKKESTNIAVRKNYKIADHFFLDKNLEPLQPLEKERIALDQLTQSKHFAGDERVKKRLSFLTGSENKLAFIYGEVENFSNFQEIQVSLAHPVETDTEDLKRILSNIEGFPVSQNDTDTERPQLILTDFKLIRKNALENNEVYTLSLKLLKREYFQ